MNTGGGHFDTIDANLTVFALANGLDLAKGEGYRRLEWFSEGLERGIVIEADGSGAFGVRTIAWRSGRPEARSEAEFGSGFDTAALRSALSGAIDEANGLGPPTE